MAATGAPAAAPRRALPDGPVATPTTEDDTNVQASIEEPADETTTRPSRAKQPARPRKRKANAPAEEEAGDAAEDASGEGSAPAPMPKKRVYKKRAAALPGEEGHEPGAPRARRVQKRKVTTQDDDTEEAAAQDDVEENGEDEQQQQDSEGERRTTRKRRAKRVSKPAREATPENAEEVEVDITEVKIADLAKDMHIGKKFSMHDELMARERAKRLQYKEKRKKAANVKAGNAGSEDDQGEQQQQASDPSASSSTPNPAPAASEDTALAINPLSEVYQVINGQIVVDVNSLAVNRQQRAADAAGHLITVVENDFTTHITSQTYLRRALKPGQWNDETTNEFYRALSRFGTDFETISRMFPGLNRKHIKTKFNREERLNPDRIKSALVGEQKELIDIEEFKEKAAVGGQAVEYQTAEEIYAEQQKREEEFEAAQKALEDAKAEEERKKREELEASLAAAKAKSAERSGKKGKKAKGGKGK